MQYITPEQILASARHPNGWDGWIPTFHSSKGFTPFDPQPKDVCAKDVVHGLSRTWRYGGHADITVAEHVLLVSEMAEILWREEEITKAALLHDACEAYSHDLQSPLRGRVSVTLPSGEVVAWTEMERRINNAIFQALGVDPELQDDLRVRAVDALGASLEYRDTGHLQVRSWGVAAIPDPVNHLEVRYLTPDTAKDLLQQKFQSFGWL